MYGTSELHLLPADYSHLIVCASTCYSCAAHPYTCRLLQRARCVKFSTHFRRPKPARSHTQRQIGSTPYPATIDKPRLPHITQATFLLAVPAVLISHRHQQSLSRIARHRMNLRSHTIAKPHTSSPSSLTPTYILPPSHPSHLRDESF